MLPFLEVLPDDGCGHLRNLLNLLSWRLAHFGSPLPEHTSGQGSRSKVLVGGAPPEGTEGMSVIVMGGSTCWAVALELWGLSDQTLTSGFGFPTYKIGIDYNLRINENSFTYSKYLVPYNIPGADYLPESETDQSPYSHGAWIHCSGRLTINK